jgi:ribosomal protein S18 acetylase RimI-like enzyme
MARGGSSVSEGLTLGTRQEYRCVYKGGAGTLVRLFKGDYYYTIEGEHAIVAEDEAGLPAGYLVWEIYEDPKTSPRRGMTKPHVFLHSAWVDETDRGQGLFSQMTRALLRRYPGYPIIGMPTHDAVSRFFNQVEKKRGRSSSPDFSPYRSSRGKEF